MLIEQTFSAVDEDGSGTVSYAEFRKHMWRRYQPVRPHQKWANFLQAF